MLPEQRVDIALRVAVARDGGKVDVVHGDGIDHEKLTYQFQGRDFRLTDVHGKVLKPILA